MKTGKHIAVFASGEGSNFEAIAQACESGAIDAKLVAMVCDRPGAKVIARAENHNVDCLVVSPKSYNSKSEMETVIADFLDSHEVDLVCLAGYMRIVGDTLLKRYDGRIINIHPALLPAFQGAHAVEDAMAYGVKVYGVTIHYVSDVVDGGRIIAQAAVPYEGSDINELWTLIHAAEHKLYPAAINKILNKIGPA